MILFNYGCEVVFLKAVTVLNSVVATKTERNRCAKNNKKRAGERRSNPGSCLRSGQLANQGMKWV